MSFAWDTSSRAFEAGLIDPCPGCQSGSVCRTPACGRLKLKQVASKPAPIESVSGDTQAPRPLKDHEVTQFVNHLARIASTYRDSEQLRCRISHVVLDTLTSHNLKAKA